MSKAELVQETTKGETLRTQDIMLLEFLRLHDASPGNTAPLGCPVCGRGLRGLTRPRCPECKHDLVLTVGGSRLRLAWLLAAVAPGCFSGFAAFFLILPIISEYSRGMKVWPFVIVDLFGWCSALFAILLITRPRRFLSQPRERQRWFAILIWIAHIFALVMFITLAQLFL